MQNAECSRVGKSGGKRYNKIKRPSKNDWNDVSDMVMGESNFYERTSFHGRLPLFQSSYSSLDPGEAEYMSQ